MAGRRSACGVGFDAPFVFGKEDAAGPRAGFLEEGSARLGTEWLACSDEGAAVCSDEGAAIVRRGV